MFLLKILSNKIILFFSLLVSFLLSVLLFLEVIFKFNIYIPIVIFLIFAMVLFNKQKASYLNLLIGIHYIYLFNLIGCILLLLFVDSYLIPSFTCYSVEGGPYSEEVRIPCSEMKDLALRYVRIVYSYTPFPIVSEEGAARFWFLVLILIEAVGLFIYTIFNYQKLKNWIKKLL